MTHKRRRDENHTSTQDNNFSIEHKSRMRTCPCGKRLCTDHYKELSIFDLPNEVLWFTFNTHLEHEWHIPALFVCRQWTRLLFRLAHHCAQHAYIESPSLSELCKSAARLGNVKLLEWVATTFKWNPNDGRYTKYLKEICLGGSYNSSCEQYTQVVQWVVQYDHGCDVVDVIFETQQFQHINYLARDMKKEELFSPW